MAEKQKTKPQNTARKSASSRRNRGRKARTPVSFSPSAKGSASTKRQPKNKSKAQKTARLAATKESSPVIHLPRLQQNELRDIVEMTFGKRDTTDTLAQFENEALSAADNDERRRISNPEIRQSPWRKICDLLITAGDGTRHTGSAWFISPRTLVTAGHCISIFSPGTPAHGMVRSILVMPARNGETNSAQSPFGWVEVPREDLRVHPNWANNGDLSFDYGAIMLPANMPLGAQTGFFGYGHFRDQDLKESEPTLSGYPDDKPDGTQWFGANLIKEVTPTRVSYNIFTTRGQSGSPVFFRNNNRDMACAIHNFGDVPFNRGVRINRQVIDQLNAWKV